MTDIVSVTVIDVLKDAENNITLKSWLYPRKDFEDNMIVEGITLFSATCRTNVILRDSQGRFVSYRNATPDRIARAVASLPAFPSV